MKRKREKIEIPEVEGVQWTDEHKMAWDLIVEGRNVALIGPGGTGKTTLVHAYTKDLLERNPKDPFVLIKAGSTGVSAVAIGGTTVHDAFGMFSDMETAETLVRRMSATKWEILKKSTVAVIDEISMVKAEQLDLIDQICKMVRGNQRPFGGLQLLMVGDPLQLQPVVKTGGKPWERNNERHMMYNSSAWERADIQVITLEEVFRQADADFSQTLLGIREGEWKEDAINLINECSKSFVERGIEAPDVITHVYPRKDSAEKQNNMAMAKLEGEAVTYRTSYTGIRTMQNILRKGTRTPEVLMLKVGALVMLTKNIDVKFGLANGIQGKVIMLEPKVVTVDFGKKIGEHRIIAARWQIRSQEGDATATQIPLTLAYAFTIHSVQGLTLDWLVVHLDGVWDLSQAYVAISRVRSKDNLMIVCKDVRKVTDLRAPARILKFVTDSRIATMKMVAKKHRDGN